MKDYKIAMEERYTEIGYLIDEVEGEIDYFEQEIQAVNENIKKLKRTFKKWDIEHEVDESVAKLNIAKEEYQYIIDGWNIELDNLKGELYRLEEML